MKEDVGFKQEESLKLNESQSPVGVPFLLRIKVFNRDVLTCWIWIERWRNEWKITDEGVHQDALYAVLGLGACTEASRNNVWLAQTLDSFKRLCQALFMEDWVTFELYHFVLLLLHKTIFLNVGVSVYWQGRREDTECCDKIAASWPLRLGDALTGEWLAASQASASYRDSYLLWHTLEVVLVFSYPPMQGIASSFI